MATKFEDAQRAVVDILGKRPRDARAGAAFTDPRHDEVMATMELVKGALEGLAGELAAARAETAAAHATTATLRQELQAEAGARNQAQTELAAERATRTAFATQLDAMIVARTALEERLDRAIAMAEHPPIVMQPQPQEPYTYQVDVGPRDPNGRMSRMLLTPLTKKPG